MPGYHFYQPSYNLARKRCPDHLTSDEIIGKLLQASMSSNDMVSRDVVFNEWLWKQHGSIWFLEDDQVVDFLMNSKFDKVSIKDIKPFDYPIMLSYPGRFGEIFRGVIIRRVNVQRRRNDLSRFYKSYGFNVEPEQFRWVDAEKRGSTEELMEFVFAVRDRRSPDGTARVRFVVPESRFDEALSGEWFKDARTYDLTKEPLTEDDLMQQKVHLKISIRACLYAQAFPDALTPGTPSKNQIMGRIPEAKGFFFRRSKGHGTSPCLHLRAAHARILRHERYRRDSDGSPREVPVKLSIVAGHEVDPKILKLLREELLAEATRLQKAN